MTSSLDDMYREVILDHYRSPRGRKPLDKANILSDGINPSCGDEITLSAQVNGDIVEDIHVDCKGCAISVASGSMLAEAVKGRSLDEVRQIAQAVRKILKGEEDAKLPEELEDIESLRGVRQFPVRVKCALLAWVTLLEGLDKLEKSQTDNSDTISTEEKD
ncbi:MAG: SUF system NifU family Fe-S cluster assembly protein [candidate division Zixibacteria bacterium]|nr:SUF system NifU family Fe-S cluster assembly protein [candidate division Zixibacteria bacterium]